MRRPGHRETRQIIASEAHVSRCSIPSIVSLIAAISVFPYSMRAQTLRLFVVKTHWLTDFLFSTYFPSRPQAQMFLYGVPCFHGRGLVSHLNLTNLRLYPSRSTTLYTVTRSINTPVFLVKNMTFFNEPQVPHTIHGLAYYKSQENMLRYCAFKAPVWTKWSGHQ